MSQPEVPIGPEVEQPNKANYPNLRKPVSAPPLRAVPWTGVATQRSESSTSRCPAFQYVRGHLGAMGPPRLCNASPPPQPRWRSPPLENMLGSSTRRGRRLDFQCIDCGPTIEARVIYAMLGLVVGGTGVFLVGFGRRLRREVLYALSDAAPRNSLRRSTFAVTIGVGLCLIGAYLGAAALGANYRG